MVRSVIRSSTAKASFRKKAFIFTFMSFFFVASVFLYVQTQQIEQQTAQVDAETLRVQRVSRFVTNLEEEYLPIMAHVTAKKAIRSMVNESITTQTPISSAIAFDEVVYRRMSVGAEFENTYFVNFSSKLFSSWDRTSWGVRGAELLPCLSFEADCKDSSGFSFPAKNLGLPAPTPIGYCTDLINLLNVRYGPSAAVGDYKLTSDLDCNTNLLAPIGTSAIPFSGKFDGEGHTISNFKLDSANPYQGLFGVTNGSTIGNLGVDIGSINGSSITGGLIGHATNTTVQDVSVTGTINATGIGGGIIGEAKNTTLLNVYANMTVKTTNPLSSTSGGLIGQASGVTTINASYFFGTLRGRTAGMIGTFTNLDVNPGLMVINNSFIWSRPESGMDWFIGSMNGHNGPFLNTVNGTIAFNSWLLDVDCSSPYRDPTCGDEGVENLERDAISLNSLVKSLGALSEEILDVPVDLDYTFEYFNVTQTDPWYLHVTMLFVYQIEDKSSSWRNVSKLLEFDVPIVGLEDPLLSYNGINIVPNISRSDVPDADWDKSKLRNSLANADNFFYVENTNAPSYLDRLQNKTGPSPYGIELPLLPLKLTNEGYNIINRSYIDYLIVRDTWQCGNTGQELFTIDGLSTPVAITGFENFTLDYAHLQKYLNNTELTNNITLVCS